MSFVAKLANPAFYVQSAKTFVSRAHDYYHPLMRQGRYVPSEREEEPLGCVGALLWRSDLSSQSFSQFSID